MRRSVVVFTDLDGTLIPVGSVDYSASKAVIKLRLMNIPVIPVTGKTLEETIACCERLNLGFNSGFVLAAEFGAIIAATPGILLNPRVKRMWGLDVIVLAEPLHKIENEILECIPSWCKVKLLTKCRPEEAARLAGVPDSDAELVVKRRFTEALYVLDEDCRYRITRNARVMNLDVLAGRRFLYVGRGIGKGKAVRVIIDSIKKRIQSRKMKIIALGDTPPDKEMLEESDLPIVIPWLNGEVLVSIRKRYVTAPYPAPKGWIWALEKIIMQEIM